MAKRPQQKPGPPRFEVKPLSALVLDQANPMGHPEKNRAKVRNSLKQLGPGRSLVVDGKDVVYAGNCTASEAAEAGITEVIFVVPERHQLVAVKRPDWTPTEARTYSIADNKTAKEAEWENPTLAEHFKSLPQHLLDATGFEKWEIDPLVAADWSPPRPGGESGDEDNIFVAFRATHEQARVINEAIDRLREAEGDAEIKEGRALELICADYLSGAPLSEEDEEEAER